MSKKLLCHAHRYIYIYTIIFPQISQAQEADTLKSQILNEVVVRVYNSK